MTKKLYNYQTEAVRAAERAWVKGAQRTPIVLATGLGKTLVIAELAKREARRGGRTLVLTHRAEILAQTHREINDHGVNCGRVMAGLDDSHGTDAVVASVHTLHRRLGGWNKRAFTLVVVDECHHASAQTYLKIMNHFGTFGRRKTRCVGLTATLARTDKRPLGDIWEAPVFVRDTAFGIEQKRLVSVMCKAAVIDDLELKNVKSSNGDFVQYDLAKAVAQSKAARVVARTYLEHATGIDGLPRRGVVFCPGVEVARQFVREFKKQGIASALVTGKTPLEERKQIFRDVTAGKTRVIVNVMVLTEGFNLPELEVVAICRPTKSKPLYVQMAGRALRNAPGKDSALILDMCGRTAQSTLATPIDLGLPVEMTREWDQADMAIWDPPPPPKKLTLVEMDALTGVYESMPATGNQLALLRAGRIKHSPDITASDALKLLERAMERAMRRAS
jgi:superfamily II DNA or RNA helicase